MMPDHGTTTRYTTYKCRCVRCKMSGNLQRKRHKVAVARLGHGILIPAEPVVKQLADLRKAGFSGRAIARATGLGQQTVNDLERGAASKVLPSTAERIAELHGLYCSPVVKDRTRYPVGPLKARLTASCGSVKNAARVAASIGPRDFDTFYRQLNRTLSWDAADWWCTKVLRCDPRELWPEWDAWEEAV